ncbi:11613_t:CDS:2 [Ambispora gerdemannii]|uniref:11613_t:CDS:1 n=1 Tax=Ambispora gerdemannii TaxID=144530 RepID=A0A9N8VE62_9GLOM|nr:11613_t:CDS:2 [Ambispora gerdemannii]
MNQSVMTNMILINPLSYCAIANDTIASHASQSRFTLSTSATAVARYSPTAPSSRTV